MAEESAYDKHWKRLAELLGPDEAAAERARMTADERADRQRKRLAKFRKDLPILRDFLRGTERDRRTDYAKRLRRQIAYRERTIAEKASEQ